MLRKLSRRRTFSSSRIPAPSSMGQEWNGEQQCQFRGLPRHAFILPTSPISLFLFLQCESTKSWESWGVRNGSSKSDPHIQRATIWRCISVRGCRLLRNLQLREELHGWRLVEDLLSIGSTMKCGYGIVTRSNCEIREVTASYCPKRTSCSTGEEAFNAVKYFGDFLLGNKGIECILKQDLDTAVLDMDEIVKAAARRGGGWAWRRSGIWYRRRQLGTQTTEEMMCSQAFMTWLGSVSGWLVQGLKRFGLMSG